MQPGGPELSTSLFLNMTTDESRWVKRKVLSLWPGWDTQQPRNVLSCSTYQQKKREYIARAVNTQINLTGQSCEIKVELLKYITPTQPHILQWEKLSNAGYFMDASWADKCQWCTISDKDIHSCLERGFLQSLQSSCAPLLNKESVAVFSHLGCQGDKWKVESPAQLIKRVSDNKSIFSHCVDMQYSCKVAGYALRLRQR